ncbi:pyocin knob domain-containing S74 family peptidase [Enterobacteriaceae bacterium H4N4]|uniref:Pyocin knob domain-containing S74 family peptidase n=1 Tax=Silvania confinis TaxID=2926470 RepID=A0A9J6QSD4_9ENTR|nr:pyocin knob domain-containing S74 family peptidase [Silvania confinis]MCU6671181.1 pyocin knob domain-containing S74 family peptidase [Silvania confinis]
MSAGTIRLTNGSTAVVGTGTAFTSDLKSGDVITATVGGIFFTLFVDVVTSNTALTLSDPFTGPTTSGLAWVAVPQLALNRITAALAAQTAESVRRVLQENANWQAFYSGTGDITVTLPDGSPAGRPLNGPSWAKIAGLTTAAQQWRGLLPTAANINNYGPTADYIGKWGKFSSVNATIAFGFPEDSAVGDLEVIPYNQFGGAQRYVVRGGRMYLRNLTAAWNGVDGPWSDWYEIGGLSSNKPLSSAVTSLSDPVAFAQNTTYVLSGTRTDSPAGLTSGQNNAIIMSVRRAGGTIMGLHQTLFTTVGTYERYGSPNTATGWTSVTWYNGGDANGWRLVGADAMAAIGLGVATQVTAPSAFDWQQADFVSGQNQLVNVTGWLNPPSGMSNPAGDVVSVFCVLARNTSNRFVVRVTSQSTTAIYKYDYTIVIAGAKGSRVFTLTQNYTSDPTTVIPINNGGTGGKTAAEARTNIGVAYGDVAGTVVQGNDSRLNNLGLYTFGTNVAQSPGGWSVKATTLIGWGALLNAKGAYSLDDVNAGNTGSFYSLLSSKSSNGTLATATYHLGVAGPTAGQYAEMYMAGISDSGTIARLSVKCSRSDVYFYVGTNSATDTYALNKTIVSDRELKDDIVYTEDAADEALSNIDAMLPTKFVFKTDDQKRERRGVIAQDLQEISAEYVKKMEWTGDDGEQREQLRLDNNALLVDALLAIHALSARVKELEAKLPDNYPEAAGSEAVESGVEDSTQDSHKTE